jgi:Zn-dependent protease
VTLDPAPATRYDLRFSALGVPVRVHPMFWLVSILFAIQLPPKFVVIWVAVVFVSILIHELGHALTIRSFGWYPLILLYTFGGLAIYQPTHRDSRKELLISLAGPAAGLLLGAFAVLVLRATHHEVEFTFGGPAGISWTVAAGIGNPYLRAAIYFLLEVTIWWSLINLLPVYPLDGGQACRQILTLLRVPDAVIVSLKISLVAAAAVAIYSLARLQDYYLAAMFGYLAYQSFNTLQGYYGRGGGYGRW